MTGAALAAVLLLDKRGPAGPTPDAFPNMLAHWPLDEAPNERAPDKTGHGNDGKMVGGGFGPGARGKAFYADGRDDQHVDVSRAKDLNFAAGAEFTLAAWYQTTESHGTVLAFRDSTGTCQWDLFVRTKHLLAVIGDDNDTSGGSFVWCRQENDGKWHHAAVTRRGKTIELYYDGVSAGTETSALATGPITTDLRAIGCNLRFVQDNERRFGRAGFKGAIDEVYVFGRALSGPEIQALMKR
ncbi:MAG: LamG domain-containing protein [Zavarzinella sp.]|nr:LamG domain-containing protein [Zavarzinella sp.]